MMPNRFALHSNKTFCSKRFESSVIFVSFFLIEKVEMKLLLHIFLRTVFENCFRVLEPAHPETFLQIYAYTVGMFDISHIQRIEARYDAVVSPLRLKTACAAPGKTYNATVRL